MPHYKSTRASHATAATTGILLVNLGTPDAPTPSAIRRYLAEFLWDPRVVEAPRWFWWLVLHGFILRFRPRRLSHVYQSVWQTTGSPLLHHTTSLSAAVYTQFADTVTVCTAMRYGNPAITDVLTQLREKNLQRLLVIPLFPQYSATTTAAVFDAITQELQTWRLIPDVRFCMHYHDHPLYIQALADSITQSFQQHGVPQKLLISFHGIPQRYITAGDPYYCHCQKTARLVAEHLGLTAEQWLVTFQSRFGREPWLQPYTDLTLLELAQQGIKHIQIIAPGFAVDCLETLEELAMQNKERYLHAGGEIFHYIPALNAQPAAVNVIAGLIRQEGAHWPDIDPSCKADTAAELQERLQRAHKLGANQWSLTDLT